MEGWEENIKAGERERGERSRRNREHGEVIKGSLLLSEKVGGEIHGLWKHGHC